MTREEYSYVSSEIQQLESLLERIPKENVINRLGLEQRLQSARRVIANVFPAALAKKARLTFRGRPVFGSRGIAAEFAVTASRHFTEAFTAVAAALAENLNYMGPIPDKGRNQLLITGTAIGSYGFEFELPAGEPAGSGQTDLFEPEQAAASSSPEEAMEKLEALFQAAAEGSDDDLAELIVEIHPRAVQKTADFLDYVAEQEAWCGLEFEEHLFRFSGPDQVRSSASRLNSSNIKERDETYTGEFQGVLPKSRTFEFKLLDQKGVLKGKVSPEIPDADIINREFLHKPVTVELHVIQVGQGRPRFTLASLEKIRE
jgi:hypothetical protein